MRAQKITLVSTDRQTDRHTERERERERETDTHTDTHTDKQTHTQTDTQDLLAISKRRRNDELSFAANAHALQSDIIAYGQKGLTR